MNSAPAIGIHNTLDRLKPRTPYEEACDGGQGDGEGADGCGGRDRGCNVMNAGW
jgi:hypothetical protein